MESYHDVVGQLIQYFQRQINLYAVVILAFSYHFLFEKDLPCTCENVPRDCTLYMVLPFGIILMAQLWMDRACQRGCRGRKRGPCGCSCDSFCFVCSRLCSAIFVSCIWIISVLIDGDWSVCCLDHSHHNISCKNNTQRTEKERTIVRNIKDKSRLYGLAFLLGLFTLAFLTSCCRNIFECFRGGDWQTIVLEEEEKIVSDELRKKAKEKLQIKLDELIERREWAKCFTVGNEVIREVESSPPEAPSRSDPPTMPPSGTASGIAPVPPSEPGTPDGTPSAVSADKDFCESDSPLLAHMKVEDA